MNRRLVLTGDQSSTLFVPELDQHYHSIHGALQESNHVFIDAGLKHLEKNKLRILEMGLGTGLNALLTAIEAEAHSLDIDYHSIEKYPIDMDEWKALNFHELPGLADSVQILLDIHQANWQEWIEISDRFRIFKDKTDLKDFSASEPFDLIYFDAFAPSAQPDLWEDHIFLKMYESLGKGGVLVTYCVKGSVRRSMLKAGFEVFKIPGPPGKREMVRAIKS